MSTAVNIEATNDTAATSGVVVGTISASGTTQATDGFAALAVFDYYRANVTGLTGGNTVTVTRGGGGQ